MDSPVIISLMLQVGGAAPPPSLEPLPKRQRPSALQGSRVPRASDCLQPNCTFFKAHGGSLFLLDQAGRLRCVTPVKSCMDRLELAASMAHERASMFTLLIVVNSVQGCRPTLLAQRVHAMYDTVARPRVCYSPSSRASALKHLLSIGGRFSHRGR
ncbi:hypothetical protein M440DRAFT_1264471 [Trichoderma longibrachiatum ATCC 18648]|uniref:Uncharacterized protein n=1 Tax=Trichoderma longibrachiatum ATCC 18648 TaxID=983965 RepID=A0A2T4C2Y4_TRILO|nr:hypothetical protein M440DRAFT_1264471 [Trichoderma longibrachiatum ATCC 18648]